MFPGNFGIQGVGYNTQSRTRVWGTDAFLSEFGAQNGTSYPRLSSSGKAVDVSEVWMKYGNLLNRMVKTAELSLNTEDAEKWKVLMAEEKARADASRTVTAADDEELDDDDSVRGEPAAGPVSKWGGIRGVRGTGKALDPEAEREQSAFLEQFHTLFTSSFSLKILPLLKRLHRLVDTTETMTRLVGNFLAWRMNYYLTKIVDEIIKAAKKTLTRPGDFILIPIPINLTPAEMSAAESYVDVTMLILEYEEKKSVSAQTVAENASPTTAKAPNSGSAKSATVNKKSSASGHKKDEEVFYRLTIINPHPLTSYHPRAITPENPSKIKQHVAVTAARIPRSKVLSEAWWAILFLMPSGANESLIYSHMLSWLSKQPYVDMIADSIDASQLSSATKFDDQSIFWKSLTYSLKYLLQRHAGCTREEAKLVRFGLRLAFVSEASADLKEMKRVKEVSKVAMQCCVRATAASVARNEKLIGLDNLERLRAAVQDFENQVSAVTSEDDTVTALPPPLDVTNGWDLQQQPDVFPLMECVRRIESTEPFAGAKIERPKMAPVNMARIRNKVTTLVEALEVIDELVLLCTRIAGQDNAISNTNLLIYSVIAETVIEILPVPLGPQYRAKSGAKCIWMDHTEMEGTREGIRYGQQAHLLKRLHEITMFFYASAYIYVQDKADELHLEAIRLTVLATLSAIADAIVRMPVVDCPSFFAQHYVGWKKGLGVVNGEKQGFSIDASHFASISADCVYVYPEALLARQSVLDYFDEVSSNVPSSNIIFRFRQGFSVPEAANIKFLTQISKTIGIAYNPTCLSTTEGNPSILCRHCPEFTHFRDIIIMFRSTNSRPLSQAAYAYNSPQWQTSVNYSFNAEGGFNCAVYGRTLDCRYSPKRKSKAAPEIYVPRSASDMGRIAEEDLLHMPNLGDLGLVCGMRDAELLLSYLTVPYMRIPLTLRFFACEDRASLLRHTLFQQLLTCVLFGADRFLPMDLSSQCPKMVPAENDQLIATPYGLLLNELCYNPTGVIDPLTRLVQLILELDSGNVANESTMRTIQFLSRVLSHTFTYLRTARKMYNGELRPPKMFRDINVFDAEAKSRVDTGYEQMRTLLLDSILPIFLSWVDELNASIKQAPKALDVVNKQIAYIYHDVVLLMQGIEPEDFNSTYVSKTFLSAIIYLTTRYSWGTHGIQEVLVFFTAQCHRRHLAHALTSHSKERLAIVLNEVVNAATGVSSKNSAGSSELTSPTSPAPSSSEWGMVGGVDCIARFCRIGDETTALLDKQNKRLASYCTATNKELPPHAVNGNYVGAKALTEMLPALSFAFGPQDPAAVSKRFTIVPNGVQDVEINLHTFTVTFKNAHLRALPEEISHNNELLQCDGLLSSGTLNPGVISSLQCAVVDETVNRMWVRLVAQDADIVLWKSGDPRIPLPSANSMRFYPEELTETEKWIHELFEPIRATYFERTFWEPPIFILLPDRKLTVDNSVVMLSAVDSSTGRLLKEIYVFRDFRVAHIYDLFSHCRRFYRTLFYSSDDRYTLFHQEVSTEARPKLPPLWQRYEMGNPNPNESMENSNGSISIVRHPFHPLNKSGSRETYLPPYLLHGLIPDALNETHSFWQDDDDNIRGYPVNMDKVSKQMAKVEALLAAKKQKQQQGNKSAVTATDANKGKEFAAAAAEVVGAEGDDDEEDDEANGTAAGSADAAKSNHILWIHWRELQFDPIGEKNTTVRVVRFANAEECPRSSEATIRKAYKNLHVDYETEEDLYAMRKDADALAEDDTVTAPEDLEAGAYQQSGYVAPPAPAGNATIEESNLLLVNMMNARKGTPLFSLAKVIGQLESLAHVLVWTRDIEYDSRSGSPMTLDLIHLPRLKLSFTAKLAADKATYLVYSMDHAHLFISNLRPSSMQGLMQGIPFGLIMADVNDNLSLLVPAIDIMRPPVRTSPFSTYVVPQRGLDPLSFESRYNIYPVHVSLSFLFTPTLAAALYLLKLRLLNRNYKESFNLAGTIGTDVAFTRDEQTIFSSICLLRNHHPLAVACFSRIALMIPESPFFFPGDVIRMIRTLPYVDIDCRLSAADERRLLQSCQSLQKKLTVVREMATTKITHHSVATTYSLTAPAQLAISRLQNPGQPVSASNAKAIRKFYRDLTNRLRERLDVRLSVEDIDKLLKYYNSVARDPLRPYLQLVLKNRQAVVEAETSLSSTLTTISRSGAKLPKTITLGENGTATLLDEKDVDTSAAEGEDPIAKYRITVTISVPPFGKELGLLTEKLEERSQILKCRLPSQNIILKNKEGRTMQPSPVYDMFYCGMKECRPSGQKCSCGNCDRTCGGPNMSGCPCKSCREFNKKEGLTIRRLPAEIDLSASQPSYQFFDIFTWMAEVLRQYAVKCNINQKEINLNGVPAVNLRNGKDFVKFYEFATGTSRVKICHANSALDIAQILLPLTYDSRLSASGIGHFMNYVVFNPHLSSKFYQLTPKELRGEKHSRILEKIYDTARTVAVQELPPQAPVVSGGEKEAGEAAAAAENDALIPEAQPPVAPAVESPAVVIPEEDPSSPISAPEAEQELKDEEEAALELLQQQKEEILSQQRESDKRLPPQGDFGLTFLPRLPYRTDSGMQLDQTSVLPIPNNCDCDKRVLCMPDMGKLSILHAEERAKLMDVQESDDVMEHLCVYPLLPALIRLRANPVTSLSRREQGVADVPSELPFNLSGHDHARKVVASDMLARIENDMRIFAERTNTTKRPKMVGLTTDAEVRAIVCGKPTPAATALLDVLDSLISSLITVRTADQEYLQVAMPLLVRTANRLGVVHDDEESFDEATAAGQQSHHTADEKAAHMQEIRHNSAKVALRRLAFKEATMNIDFIIASLATLGGERDWIQLNPFLDAATCEAIMNMTAVVVLRANRIAHLNRACDAAHDLREWVEKATALPRKFQNERDLAASQQLQQDLKSHVEGVVASVTLKADALADHLFMKRCYFETIGERDVPHPSIPNKVITSKLRQYDARFLLFEFTWSLVLRDRQRELITEMYDSVAKQEQSLVKQMIMGAGKTTVVGPLLGVMLSNGSNLVLQVVPPALLDFTRSVMRTTFSSVMRKQIFSFTCDRSGQVDSEIIHKFEHAKASRGIVVTTPNSIKSIFLKYVEALDKISDAKRNNRSIDDEKEARDLHRVITMWRQSVLVMDEVDLILHPLKSELNFPVGPKEDIDFSPIRWKLPIHLLDAIFYCTTHRVTTNLKDSGDAVNILKEFRQEVENGLAANSLQSMPHLTLLNVEFYEEKLKPLLAKWLLLFIKSQLFVGLSDEDTLKYITRRPGLFSTAAQRAKAYNTTIDAAATAEDEEIAAFIARVSALDEGYIKVLNLSFEWLTCYLPHIWQKVDRVSYGIMNHDDMAHALSENPHMPQSRFVTAIPFVGKDLPSQSSEFAHPDVVIGLTVLAYRYEGMRDRDFQQVMTDMYTQVEAEVGKYSQRRTNLLFNRWVELSGGRVVTSFNYKSRKGAQRANSDEGSAAADANQTANNTTSNNTAAPQQQITEKKGGKVQEILPLKLLKQANTVEIGKLFKLFRKTAEVIYFYLTESLFPTFMKHQNTKLSASGQELGGSILFDRRVGFSGTPSDLLPIELGKCAYEKGTDGQLIHTLTDIDVVKVRHVGSGWSVKTLLNSIATHEVPYRYNALIDTGALITGMSNKQVAAYLLRHGLKEMDGVVFLDELDRKMILVRATGRVLKLAECGIPKHRRFAFYDQVHTTGMDIEHVPNAYAVQTIGKDMTFRDYSQGAYRMRGIGVGQKVDLMIIPEVKDLINRTLATVKGGHRTPSSTSGIPPERVNEACELQDVTAWLLTNSMRSEHTQNDQLCMQSCSNVWRKEAFAVLTDRISEFKIDAIDKVEAERQQIQLANPILKQETDAKRSTVGDNVPSGVRQANLSDVSCAGLSTECNTSMNVFREPVIFDVNGTVPKLKLFSEIVEDLIEASRALIRTADGNSVVDALLARARREDEVANPAVDVQVVQEQEEERDKEQEEEKEQQIEIEKYVDLAYSRDSETQTPWAFTTLESATTATQFYPLSSFHLYKRRPIDFPDCIFLSRNFFNPRWSGHRRVRNVIAVMEWIPNTNTLKVRAAPSCDYGSLPEEETRSSVSQLFDLVRNHEQLVDEAMPALANADVSELSKDARTRGLIKDILEMALQRQQKLAAENNNTGLILPGAQLPRMANDVPNAAGDSEKEWERVLNQIVSNKNDLAGGLHTAITSNDLRLEEEGRYYVVLSLAEAETIRRITHLRSTEAALMPTQSTPTTAITLKAASCSFATLDKSQGYAPPPSSFMPSRTYQSLRFFDCDLHYTEREFGLLLRSIHTNNPRSRQAFFQQVCGCRRRLRQRWERTPIAGIFILGSAFSLLKQRAVGLCVRRYFERMGLSFGEAFMACNSSRSGVLSPAELWGGLRYCQLGNLTLEEVVDFIEIVDSTHEHQIQYGDFLAALTGSKDYDEDAAAAAAAAAAANGGNAATAMSSGNAMSNGSFNNAADSLERASSFENAGSSAMYGSRAQTMEELIYNGGESDNKNLPEIDPYGADLLKGAMATRAALRRAAEAEANAEMEEENQRVLDVIEEEEIAAEVEAMTEKHNPILLPSSGINYFFSFRSDATNETLYGKDYAEDIEASTNKNAAKKKKKVTTADEENDDDDDEEKENNMLSLEERRERRNRRPLTLELPAVAKAFGNRVRTTLDVDGTSCLTVHNNSCVTVPLRILKRLLGSNSPAIKIDSEDKPKSAHLRSYAISAEVRFPNNASAIQINKENTDQSNASAKKKAPTSSNNNNAKAASDSETSVLTKLSGLKSSLNFADWILPMLSRTTLPDSVFSFMFTQPTDAADDKDDDDKEEAQQLNPQQEIFMKMQQQQQQMQQQKQPQQQGGNSKDKMIVMTADYIAFINKNYFFLQETLVRTNGEGTLLNDVPSLDVLITNPSSAAASGSPTGGAAGANAVRFLNGRRTIPKKSTLGLRILKDPRPPRQPSDILGVVMDGDHVIISGTRTLNEINNIVFEWIQITSPCEGWIVSQRETVKTKYTGPEGGSATSSAMPAMAIASAEGGAGSSGPSANPTFVSQSSVESKPFTNFFAAVRTRLVFEPNGNAMRIEHTQLAYTQASARFWIEPSRGFSKATFTPSSQLEMINDREMEVGKAIAAKGDTNVGELAGEVNDLLMMIIKAKRLRQGCKVVRNPDHRNSQETATKINDQEIGVVTEVDNETATVRWPGGNSLQYAWGKGGIFELVKVDDEESDEENELNEDGTVKRYTGGLGGRQPVNDERHSEQVKRTGDKCDNCGASKLILSNWFRCNHCADYDLCRKCYKTGTHDEHDFTDMAALDDQITNSKNGKKGDGEDDKEGGGGLPAGVYDNAKVRIKTDVVAPRFGWGTDHETVLEEQQADPTRPDRWPQSLAGFIGIVTDIDRNTKAITVQIENAQNSKKMVDWKEKAADVNADGSEDDFRSRIINFVADYSEVEPMQAVEENETTAITYESPTGYANLFKMLPYAYFMCSVFESRINVPASANAAADGRPISSLRSSLADTRVNVIAGECPYIKALAAKAAVNLLSPFTPNQMLVRRQREVTVLVAAVADFADMSQKTRVARLNAFRIQEEERMKKAAAKAARDKRRNRNGDSARGDGSDASAGSGSSSDSGSDEEDNEAEKKAQEEEEKTKRIVPSGSIEDHEALFSTKRLPFEVRINASCPYHLTNWQFTTSTNYGGIYTNEKQQDYISVPYKNDMLVRFVNFPTEEKPLEYPVHYFKMTDYPNAIGHVTDVNYRNFKGKAQFFLTVRWNIEYAWGGEIVAEVRAEDVEEVKNGQWYIRQARSPTTTPAPAAAAAVASAPNSGSSSAAAAAATPEDDDDEDDKKKPQSEGNDDEPIYPKSEENKFFSAFDDGGAAPLPSAVNAMLERGLRDGVRVHTVFIRDDNYDVDLATGEVRRMKPANERTLKIDDDLIDLTTMSLEQRNQVSRLMGTVTRVPHEAFIVKEKPPSIDDGLRHIISFVVQEGADGTMSTQFVVDGNIAPLQLNPGTISPETIKDASVRNKLLSQALRLFINAPISFFSSDFRTSAEAKDLEGPLCSVYNLRLDIDETDEGEEERRDLLVDTIAWHHSIDAAYEWECQECKHVNARLATRCARCKKARRARVVSEQDTAAKFRVAGVASREAMTIRSRLQGKLKAQYQRELDTIDRAQEEIKNARSARKAEAEQKRGKK